MNYKHGTIVQTEKSILKELVEKGKVKGNADI